MRGWSTHWYAELWKGLGVVDIGAALRRSLALGTVVMALTVLLSLGAGLAFRKRLRGGDATEEDQFPEVFTDFYNWAAEQKDIFDEELAKAQALFKQAAELMGEPVKEPADLFDVLEKFIRRFDTAAKEFDEEKRAAEEQQRRTDAHLKTDAQVAKKTLR